MSTEEKSGRIKLSLKIFNINFFFFVAEISNKVSFKMKWSLYAVKMDKFLETFFTSRVRPMKSHLFHPGVDNSYLFL